MFKGGTCLSKCHKAIKRFSEDVDLGIAEKYATEGMYDVVEECNLSAFEVNASSMERTFCDKVFALCDYYLAKEPLRRHSRHIYDLRKLQGRISLDDPLTSLFGQVKEQRKGKPSCLSAEDSVVVADVLDELVATGAYRDDYVGVTADLLYEDMPYEEAVKALGSIAAFLRDAQERQQHRVRPATRWVSSRPTSRTTTRPGRPAQGAYVYAADIYDGRPAIAMELMDSVTLETLLESAPLMPCKVFDALNQPLDAVGYAHENGIVHGRIAPENNFIGERSRVKLVDFRIMEIDTDNAIATCVSPAESTPLGYMSPE